MEKTGLLFNPADPKWGLTLKPSPFGKHLRPIFLRNMKHEEHKKRRAKARSSTALLLWQLRKEGLKRSQYELEKRFCNRLWRFDICFPQWGLAVEIQGLDRSNRGHQSIKGFSSDCEKFSTAFAMGWNVVPVLHSMVMDGSALDCILSGLKTRGDWK